MRSNLYTWGPWAVHSLPLTSTQPNYVRSYHTSALWIFEGSFAKTDISIFISSLIMFFCFCFDLQEIPIKLAFINLKKAVYLLKTSSFALSLIHCLIHWSLYNWQIHACVPCFTVNSYSWLGGRGHRCLAIFEPLFEYHHITWRRMKYQITN